MKRKCFLSFFALMICTLGFAASDADIALFNAVKVKRLDLVNAYVRSANANARFEWAGKSMTTFQMALENKDVNIAKVLIADGNADVNAGWGDEPPIFIVAREKDSGLTELLIGSGADVNSTYNGMTPVIYSVMTGENAGPFLHSFENIAKNMENAKKFIDYLTSYDAQKTINEKLNRRSVRDDLPPSEILLSVDKINVIKDDDATVEANKQNWLNKFKDIFTGI